MTYSSERIEWHRDAAEKAWRGDLESQGLIPIWRNDPNLATKIGERYWTVRADRTVHARSV